MDTELTGWVESAPEATEAIVDRAVRSHLLEHPEYLLPLCFEFEEYETYGALDALDISAHDLARLPLGVTIERIPGTNQQRLFRTEPEHHDMRLWAEDGVDIPNRASAVDLLAIQYLLDTTRPSGKPGHFDYTPNTVPGGLAKPREVTEKDIQEIFNIAKEALFEVGYSLNKYGRPLIEEAQNLRDQRHPELAGSITFHEELLELLEKGGVLARKVVYGKPIKFAIDIVTTEPQRVAALVDEYRVHGDPVLDFTGFIKKSVSKDPEFQQHILEPTEPGLALDLDMSYSPLFQRHITHESFGRVTPRELYAAAEWAIGDQLAKAALSKTPEWAEVLAREKPLFYTHDGIRFDASRVALAFFTVGAEKTVELLVAAEDREIMLDGIHEMVRLGKDAVLREAGLEQASEIYRAGLIKRSGLDGAVRFLWFSMTRVTKFPHTPFTEEHIRLEREQAKEEQRRRQPKLYIDNELVHLRCVQIFERAKRIYAINPSIFPNLGSTDTFEQYLTRQILYPTSQDSRKLEWLVFDVDVPGVDEETICRVLAENAHVVTELLERRISESVLEDGLSEERRAAILHDFEVQFGPEMRQEAQALVVDLVEGNDLVLAFEGLKQAAFVTELFRAAADNIQIPRERLLKRLIEKSAEVYGIDATEIESAITPQELLFYFEHAERISALRHSTTLPETAGWRTASKPRPIKTPADEICSFEDLHRARHLTHQTELGQAYYVAAALLLGRKTIDSFLSPSRKRLGLVNGGHYEEVLGWVDYAVKLSPENLTAVLESIDSDVEQFELSIYLTKYEPENDQLAQRGPIRSIRELKVRVEALGRDFSAIKDRRAWDVLSKTPGMDFAALEEMCGQREFHELLRGDFDAFQPFSSFEVLVAPKHDVATIVQTSLGSRKNNTPGTAADPAKLYHDLKHLMKRRGVTGSPADLFESVPKQIEAEVLELVRGQDSYQEESTGPLYRATLHDKSDPLGWVCGNYTDCCMPFGRSLNTDYMFNPDTQYFTIRRNGRIIAQSVVIAAQDAGTHEPVVVLDGLEIANNYRHLREDIIAVYRKVWGDTYDGKPVLIGTFRKEHPITREPYEASVSEHYISRSGSIGYTDAWGYFLFPFTPS